MIRCFQEWDERAAPFLSHIEGLTLGQIKREFAHPGTQLWEFSDDAGVAGFAVTRLERDADQHEWVWLACGGRDFLKFARILQSCAQASGIGIRAYVQRPGMRRMYERLGFRVAVQVMEFR